MSAWQWCTGVVGRIHVSHPTTLCCRQVLLAGAWVGAGGRESSGGGDLGVDTGGVVVFAGPEGAGYVERVPYDDLGCLNVVAAATSSGSGSSQSSDSEKCGKFWECGYFRSSQHLFCRVLTMAMRHARGYLLANFVGCSPFSMPLLGLFSVPGNLIT